MFFLCFLLSFGLLAYAQSSITPLGDIPLAVKTPYLHSWILSNNLTAPGQTWPGLFTQAQGIGWNGIIRVDGQPYQWLGNASVSIANFAKTVASKITPTNTKFTIQAGHMKFNATFFSPVEPNNYTRQSIPFTYLYVDGFIADDEMPHTIQMYSDISAQWVSADDSKVTWDTQSSGNMVYHHVSPDKSQSMTDIDDSAEELRTAYYATPKRPGLTWQTGVDVDCRTLFSRDGSLRNSKDIRFRAVNDAWPVFSLAIDLGPIVPNNEPDPVIWALGLVHDPVVHYKTESGFELRMAYYWSSYQNIDDVISDFLVDFPSARQRGQNLDDLILNAALEISSEYAGIVSLVTRQIFASMDITIPVNKGEKPRASDVKIFMKDISMSTRVNPVEVIYAAFPALLYFNPSFAHDLLLPLLDFQSSSTYPNSYASPDLGNRYPTITGNNNATEEFAIEHCGNMLIMVYTHAAKSGDPSLISKYHPLLRKWAEYLVQYSKHPNSALSPDGFHYSGDISNLVLKGILGIYFMGKIDELINPSNTTFMDMANELLANWKQLAVTDTHIQAEYGKSSTWGLMYNLFPAIWLQTGLIDDGIVTREARFYSSNRPLPDQSYSLDSEGGKGIAYPHWALMTAAIIPSDFVSVRDTLINSTYHQAYNVSRVFPLPMRYMASTGESSTGTTGSAAQGAAFAILAKGMKNQKINIANFIADTEKKSPVGGIVGGVIGSLAFLLIVASAVFFWRRRRVQHSRVLIDLRNKANPQPQPFLTQYSQINITDSTFQLSKQSPAAGISPLQEPRLESLHARRPYPAASERNHQPPITSTTPPIPPFQPLSSKQREQNRPQPSEPAVSFLTNANSSSGSGREDALRAEVDELRREMEAIRYITQPPPGYQ